jgi:hypothetical protein
MVYILLDWLCHIALCALFPSQGQHLDTLLRFLCTQEYKELTSCSQYCSYTVICVPAISAVVHFNIFTRGPPQTHRRWPDYAPRHWSAPLAVRLVNSYAWHPHSFTSVGTAEPKLGPARSLCPILKIRSVSSVIKLIWSDQKTNTNHSPDQSFT